MTIKKKILLILSALVGLSIIIIFYTFVVSSNLIQTNKELEEISRKLVLNTKIEAAHERFMGNMSRKLINQEKYSVSSTSKTCILGTWYYLFEKSKEFKELPSNVKSKLNDLEVAHVKIHEIATKFMNASEVNDEIKKAVAIDAPKHFESVIAGLKSYSAVLSQQKEEIIKVSESETQILKISLGIILVITIIFALWGLRVSSSIIQSITTFKDGLSEFFKFLNRQTNEVKEISFLGNDEIAQMSREVNENIQKTKIGFEKDNEVIQEALEVVNKAKGGFYQYDIMHTASNPELEMLRIKINEMTDIVQASLTLVTEALIAFGNAKYSHKIQADYSGTIGSLVNGTSALGDSISEVLCMVNNTAQRLTTNASDLAVTSEELSASAIEQAASLEETAAAIEQITSAIHQTNEKTQRMSQIAIELKETSDEDDELAHKTGEAMDHINNATNAIVEAIEIIDQIAFQTNILSLNAAVEAATAGEAGKGFAVVAQEVRNLAARSAEAAKEIKDLVHDAQVRTKEGKDTADKMVESFNSLNEKVSEVTTIVSEVTNATNEQMQGMEQINSAVNELDKATQENANASETVSQKAMSLNEISEHLVAIIQRTEFDKGKQNMVCDVNLVFDTTKLKLDHIKFKEANFKDIGINKQWKVKTDHECDLGKWIDTHQNENYAQHSDWGLLLEAHHNVHKFVQDYIDLDSKDKYSSQLPQIANDIEKNTHKVFTYIDKLKEHRCENALLGRDRETLTKIDNPIEHSKEIKAVKKKSIKQTKTVLGNKGDLRTTSKKQAATKKVQTITVQESKDEWESF